MDQQRLLHQARARPVSRLTDLKQEEAKCRDYQYMVLKRIGASRYELTYLKAQTGDYLDLNGDGEFDWKDYELRDW